MTTDKYRYLIFPERLYTVDWDGYKVQISGEDIVNIIPDILRKKYVEAMLGYEEVPFDNTQEGLVE